MTGPVDTDQQLGRDDRIIRTETFAELLAATDHMAAQAQLSLRIVALDTEPELYGREAFAALVADFIRRRHKVARVQLLLADPRRATQVTHHLVQLWHRFPSFIEFRELRDEYARTREALMIVDDTGIIRRPEAGVPAAVITYRSLTTARDRAAWFAEAFARAAPCSVLRRLSL